MDNPQRQGPVAYTPKTWRISADIGTTFSSVVFCLRSESTTGLQKDSVIHVNKWPEEESSEESRIKVDSEIPTCLRYEEGGRIRAGWEAIAAENYPSRKRKNGVFIDRFKLLLDTSEYTSDLREEIRLRLATIQRPLTVLDLLADYLGKLFVQTKASMMKYKLHDDDDIELVLTVPSIWSPNAVRKMFTAVDMASQSSGLRIGNTRRAVSETEAAMAYVLHPPPKVADKPHEGPKLAVQEGDYFMICDAGGGTVDCVPYKLSDTRLIEVASSTGALCGSTYLDKGFKKQLTQDLIATRLPKLDIDSKSMRQRIDRATVSWATHRKKSINQEKRIDDWTLFSLHECEGLELEKFEVDLYCFTSKAADAVFSSVVSKVWALVDGQIKRMRDLNHLIKAVVFVGGFSESLWLQKYINDRCEKKYGIQAIFPAECRLAVVEGAMIWARLEKYQADRISRFSVGIRQHMDYDKKKAWHKHIEPDVNDFGELYVRDCVEWVIKRGAKVPYNGLTRTYSVTVRVTEENPRGVLELDIYVSHTNAKDNYRLDDPRNADAECIDRIEHRYDLTENLPNMKPAKAKPAKKRQKNNSGTASAPERYYLVNFLIYITVNDLLLSYRIQRQGARNEGTEGTVMVSHMFQPGTVTREEDAAWWGTSRDWRP